MDLLASCATGFKACLPPILFLKLIAVLRAAACAGVKYPLDWIPQIKAKSTDETDWRVLIDAAAYVPTQPLDLRKVNPDFVSMSFYKMFGYPTVSGTPVQSPAASQP